ncbi:hypothetical protein WG66_016789 [Moniliophthora roreri]|nr:hypothetical protein WG66_016789 [Moniliophthora roreri]
MNMSTIFAPETVLALSISFDGQLQSGILSSKQSALWRWVRLKENGIQDVDWSNLKRFNTSSAFTTRGVMGLCFSVA